MNKTYIQYYKQNKLCVYRTLKSYAKYKARIYALAIIQWVKTRLNSKKADISLNVTTNA